MMKKLAGALAAVVVVGALISCKGQAGITTSQEGGAPAPTASGASPTASGASLAVASTAVAQVPDTVVSGAWWQRNMMQS